MSSLWFGIGVVLLAMSSVYLGRSATRPKPHEIRKQRITGLAMLGGGALVLLIGGLSFMAERS